MSAFASKVDGMSEPQGADVDASDRERGMEPTTLSTASMLRQLMWKREGAALLLIVVAELLALTWYFVVNLLADNKTLYFEYTFAPRSTTTFIIWRVVAIVSVSPPFVAGIKLAVDDVADSRKSQRKLALVGTIFAIILFAGNILGAVETCARTNYESEFAVKFNDFFCDTRTLRVCLEGSHDEMLVIHDMRKDATKSILTKELSAFLHDCSDSHDVDVWYKSEWVVRMQFSNGLLGGAAVCFLVAARILWY